MTFQAVDTQKIEQTGSDSSIPQLPKVVTPIVTDPPIQIPDENLFQKIFNNGFATTNRSIITDVVIEIQGDVEISIPYKEFLEMTFQGTLVNELSIKGTFNLTGHSDSSGTVFKNWLLNFDRKSGVFFRQTEAGLKIEGISILKNGSIITSCPIWIAPGCDATFENLTIQALQFATNTKASPASMRVFEEMTFNNIEMYMRTDVFIAFKESIGVTYYQSDTADSGLNIYNRRTGNDGTDLQNPQTGIRTVGAPIKSNGFARVSILNSLGFPQILIWRFLPDGGGAYPDVPVAVPQTQDIKFTLKNTIAVKLRIDTEDFDNNERQGYDESGVLINQSYYYKRESQETLPDPDFVGGNDLSSSRRYKCTVDVGSLETNIEKFLTRIVYNDKTTPTNQTVTDYRISDYTRILHKWTARAYGYKTQNIEASMQAFNDASSNIVLLENDTQILYAEAYFSEIQKIDNENKIYACYQYLITRDEGTDLVFTDGFDADLVESSGFKVTLKDGWDLTLKKTTSLAGLEFESNNITALCGETFSVTSGLTINGALYDQDAVTQLKSLIDKDIPDYISGLISWLVDDNGTEKRQYLYNFTVEATSTTDYIFEIWAVKGTVKTHLKTFETIGTQQLKHGIFKEDYDSLEIRIHGGEVQAETIAIAIDQFQNTFTTIQNRDAVQEWIDQWTTKNISIANSKITFNGDMTGRGLNFFVWAVNHYISQFNKNKPVNQRLTVSDFITVSNLVITVKKEITNTDFPIQEATGYLGLIFVDANVGYLSQTLPVIARTSTKANFIINGLEDGDTLLIQTQGQDDKAIIQIIDQSFVGIFDLSETYELKVLRKGFDSDYFTINSTTSTVTAIFFKIAGFEYTDDTSISDKVILEYGDITLLGDTVLPTDTYEEKKQPEIDMWFNFYQKGDFPIKSPHILKRIKDESIILNYPFATKVTTHADTGYAFLQRNNGTEIRDVEISNVAEGGTLELSPQFPLSEIVTTEGTIEAGVHLRFINIDGSIYNTATATSILTSFGNQVFISVSPGLDQNSNYRNYRGKRIQFAYTHLQYIEKLTCLVANQYLIEENGTTKRVEKEISFLPRPSISVSGGFQATDRALLTDTTKKSQVRDVVNIKIIAENFNDISLGFFIYNSVQYGELVFQHPYRVFGRDRTILFLYIDSSVPDKIRLLVEFSKGTNENLSSYQTLYFDSPNLAEIVMQRTNDDNNLVFSTELYDVGTAIVDFVDGVESDNLKFMTAAQIIENPQFIQSDAEELFKQYTSKAIEYVALQNYKKGDIVYSTSGKNNRKGYVQFWICLQDVTASVSLTETDAQGNLYFQKQISVPDGILLYF